MSRYSYSPFWDFFDSINQEVNNFNRLIDDAGFRVSKPTKGADKKLTEGESKPESQAVTTTNPNRGVLSAWRPFGFDWDIDEDLFAPPIDLIDNKDNYEVHASVPGAFSKDIHVDFDADKNELSISGEIPETTNEENKDSRKFIERRTGKFERRIQLPKNVKVDEENIAANYVNGVLQLKIPKAVQAETKTKKRIEVKTEESKL